MNLQLLALAAFCILASESEAKTYRFSKALGETVTLYENTCFDLEVDQKGNDSTVFLQVKKAITIEDNIRIQVVMKRNDNVEFPLMESAMNICSFLEQEVKDPTSIMGQLRFSKALRLENRNCPLREGTKRLSPFMFPQEFELQNDIGCGKFTCAMTVLSCAAYKCTSMLQVRSEMVLETDNCSNKFM